MTDSTDPSNPRWLDENEKAAWMGLLTLSKRAFPEIERDLRSHDLLGVHYHIFVTLSAAPDRTMRLSDLACSADVSQSRLTHRLRVLVERGDVEINLDPHDGRAKLATLTAAGVKRLEEIAPLHVKTVRRVVFDHLTKAQTAALADALAPIVASLNDHPEYLNP